MFAESLLRQGAGIIQAPLIVAVLERASLILLWSSRLIALYPPSFGAVATDFQRTSAYIGNILPSTAGCKPTGVDNYQSFLL